MLAFIPAASGMLVWRLGIARRATLQEESYKRHAIALVTASLGVALAVILAPPYHDLMVTLVGVGVIGLFTESFVRLPDDTESVAVRLHRTLDGLFIAGCVTFCVWVTWVPQPVALETLSSHWMIVLTSGAAAVLIGVAAVTTVRATTYRRRYLLLGVSLSVIALSHVGIVTTTQTTYAVWPSGILLLVGGLGCLSSAAAVWFAQTFPGPATARPLPLVDLMLTAGPAVIAAAVAVYHGIAVGPLGVDAIVLAIVTAAVLSVRQILARMDVRKSAQVLADREERYRSIVAGSADVTTVVDDKLRVVWQEAAPTWKPVEGHARVEGTPFIDIVHPDDAESVERQLKELMASRRGARIRVDARIRDAQGNWRDTESTVADQRDVPQVRGLVLHSRDVGQRRKLERKLAKLAYADTLTSLSNRRALLRTLESDVAGGTMPCTLLAIDLDGFKKVNDTQGHDIGDAVLKEVASRIKESLRPTDVAARLGGDEFAVLLWCPPEHGYEIAQRLLEVLRQPYCFEGQADVHVSTSIGLAGYSTADDVESLLRNADLALRSAKQQGKNRVAIYDMSFERVVRRKNLLENELHGAIARGELALVYQPVISLTSRHIVGAEALMRWNHPELGAVPPSEFIPVVEDAGLTSMLGAWTSREIAARLAVWRQRGYSAWISMNVSVRQLHSPMFATDLAQALLERGVPPSRLVVEVTEHDVAQDMDVLVAQLGALRGTGVRIALDDFGAGYSSLGQLHRLPVDILKIDRDLVAGTNDGAAPLADVVVRLGERLDLDVIAEGVETQTQLDVVAQAGCDMVQGYFLARPMSVEKVDSLLREDSKLRQQPLAIES